MNRYDLVCPACGRKNRCLYLDETDGWMECEYCGRAVQDQTYRNVVMIPVYRTSREGRAAEHPVRQRTGC